MKQQKYIAIGLLLCLISVCLTSCDGCSSNLEEFGSRSELFNADLDGDGDYGDRSGEYNNPSFKSSNHVHIDEHIPWNNCDICGKHKVDW